jgi:hypothetical protein
MRRRGVTTVGIAAIAAGVQIYFMASGLAQAPTAGAAPAATDIDPSLTEELKRVEHTLGLAIQRHDAEALDRLIAPGFTLRVADPSGQPSAGRVDGQQREQVEECCVSDALLDGSEAARRSGGDDADPRKPGEHRRSGTRLRVLCGGLLEET